MLVFSSLLQGAVGSRIGGRQALWPLEAQLEDRGVSGLLPRQIEVLAFEGDRHTESLAAKMLRQGHSAREALDALLSIALRRWQETDGIDEELSTYWLLMVMEVKEVKKTWRMPRLKMQTMLQDLQTIRSMRKRAIAPEEDDSETGQRFWSSEAGKAEADESQSLDGLEVEEEDEDEDEDEEEADEEEREEMEEGNDESEGDSSWPTEDMDGNAAPQRRALQAFADYFTGLRRSRLAGHRLDALIMTCSFGGGHLSAAKAVEGFLSRDDLVTDILDTTLAAEMVTPALRASAYMFNEVILKKQQYKYNNIMDNYREHHCLMRSLPCPLPKCNSERKHKLRGAVLRRRPRMLVTVYHMDLVPFLEVAKELGNLGLVHLATDINIKMAEVFRPPWDKPTYPRWLIGVPFDLDRSWKTTAPVSESNVFVSGYPVRREFLRPRDPEWEEELAKEREAIELDSPGAKILLVMTGGGGQDTPAVDWLAELGPRVVPRLHIIVVAGGNDKIAQRYHEVFATRMLRSGRIIHIGVDGSVSIEVATDPSNTKEDKPYFLRARRLALLIDLADAVLSKPGGGSTAEIAYRGAPALFDTSKELLLWEQYTVDTFVDYKRAETFSDAVSLRRALPRAMALGRSWSLIESEGRIVSPEERCIEACQRILSMAPQQGWQLFKTAAEPSYFASLGLTI